MIEHNNNTDMTSGSSPTLKDIKIQYYSDGSFFHNLRGDFHLFCIWEAARRLEKSIIGEIGRKFRHIAQIEIEWSKDRVEENFQRLYRAVGLGPNRKHETVGRGPFLCLIVEDTEPEYVHCITPSGKFELCNRKIVEQKKLIRDWLGGYLIHSTVNPYEFTEQVHLLLPRDAAQNIFATGCYVPPNRRLTRDLTGAGGWESFEALFEHLTSTTNYVMLRNFEWIPDGYPGNDIDLLCYDPAAVLSSINGLQSKIDSRAAQCRIVVSGKRIPVDISFVGDGYYDSAWQKDILDSSVLYNNLVRTPRVDHLFFSLLYHATFQKHNISEKYVTRLEELGDQLKLPRKVIEMVKKEKSAVSLIRSFLSSSGYCFYTPLDPDVYTNRTAVSVLPPEYVTYVRKPRGSVHGIVFNECLRAARRVSPRWLRYAIPEPLKAWARRDREYKFLSNPPI
jgi:hypothetical protein